MGADERALTTKAGQGTEEGEGEERRSEARAAMAERARSRGKTSVPSIPCLGAHA
jgi:hypothetical protein